MGICECVWRFDKCGVLILLSKYVVWKLVAYWLLLSYIGLAVKAVISITE